jgi:hypothetical protein
VTGGGFIALAAIMPAIGVLPIAALTLLVGVGRFVAGIRAAANLTGNIVATLVSEGGCRRSMLPMPAGDGRPRRWAGRHGTAPRTSQPTAC